MIATTVRSGTRLYGKHLRDLSSR